MTESLTNGQKFYQKQLDFLYANDSEGLIDSNYDVDAVLHSFDHTIEGNRALKEYFKGYLEMLGSLKVISTDKWTETENTIFFIDVSLRLSYPLSIFHFKEKSVSPYPIF